ncbi:MAG: transcription antitermination factor NusB [Bacteroidales bacterium]
MVSRRYLRTKVMQAIFAYEMNSEEGVPSGEKKLDAAINSCYTLFLYFFSIFPEIRRYRLNKFEDIRGKINPTFEDLNPNTKFVDNEVLNQIENNTILNKLWKEHKVNWTNETDFIIQIYQEIIELDEYKQYMNSEYRSYQEDKKLILDILEKVFVESQLLHWYFQEKNVHWFDDYNDALMMMYKNISAFKENQNGQCKIVSLFKDEEDVSFYKTLFRKTLINNNEYEKIIEDKLQNWELERVMGLDMILMKMALCEFLEFPTVPVKVTINEYIELSKTYSSAKSRLFINGLLDKIIFDLKREGRLNKIGRGLLEK